MTELADAGIHLHFYGNFSNWKGLAWIDDVRTRARQRRHFHEYVDQRRWVSEFSRYDAGWLHYFASDNGCEIRRCTWDDLNYPARIPPLVGAGLPLTQRDNEAATVATQSLARKLDIGLFFAGVDELVAATRDKARMSELSRNAWRERDRFTFDHHADRLIAFFRRVVESRTR